MFRIYRYLNGWAKFVYATKFCLKEKISVTELAEIGRYFREFVTHYERYGRHSTSITFRDKALILISLENISGTSLEDFLLHSFLIIICCILLPRFTIPALHGKPGSIRWRDYVECYCLSFTPGCGLI